MKILSLFSGAGGLDLGLIQAGNTVIWANDMDVNAVETYRYNIGNHIVLEDIKNIDIASLSHLLQTEIFCVGVGITITAFKHFLVIPSGYTRYSVR